MKFTRLLPVLFFWIIFPAFYNGFILIVQLKIDRKQGEGEGGITCSKGQQVRSKHTFFPFYFLYVFLCFVMCAIYLRLIKPAAGRFFILRSA